MLGEPSNRVVPVTQIQQQVTEKETESYTLRLQVEMLEKQIKKLEENELFLKEQITTKDQSIHLLQTLLSAPQSKDVSLKQQEGVQEHSPQALSESKPPKTEDDSREEQVTIKPRTHRRGILGRAISAIFND